MARIRTIKPELPLSESLGKVSREARLLFILLFTIVDDSGRTRAASRILASLLYPFDEDAPSLIDGWLAELEAIDSIRLYRIDGTTYLEIVKWLQHQKIDKPSASKLPPFDESSRILASPREPSRLYLGSSTKDIGSRKKKEKPSASPIATESKEVPASPATAVAVVSGEKVLYEAIWETFLSKTEHFSNYGKEGAATKKLVSLFMVRDDPEATAKAVILRYYELTQGGDKFWSKQPFLPSSLLSLFDRVLKDLEVDRPLTAEDFIFDEAIPL